MEFVMENMVVDAPTRWQAIQEFKSIFDRHVWKIEVQRADMADGAFRS